MKDLKSTSTSTENNLKKSFGGLEDQGQSASQNLGKYMGGAIDLAGSFASPVDKFDNTLPGGDQRADLRSITSQDFSTDWAGIGQSALSGATSLATGNVLGAVTGFGGALIKGARNLAGAHKFRKEQNNALASGLKRNSNLDFRDQRVEDIGMDIYRTTREFYG